MNKKLKFRLNGFIIHLLVIIGLFYAFLSLIGLIKERGIIK